MANTFELIYAATVGSGGAADITFNTIPSTYTDLCLLVSARSTSGTNPEDMWLRVNGSSTSYANIQVYGNGASASSNAPFGGDRVYIGAAGSAGTTSSTFGNCSVYIPNYAGSTNKSFSVDAVNENNGTTAYANLVAARWSNTSAITSILIAGSSGNLVQYTTAYLYGVKNA